MGTTVCIILGSVLFTHSTLREISEERKSHLHRGSSLKSCMCMTLPHHFQRFSVSAPDVQFITSYLYRKIRRECTALCHCSTHSTPSTWTIPYCTANSMKRKRHCITSSESPYEQHKNKSTCSSSFRDNVWEPHASQTIRSNLRTYPTVVTPENVQQPTGSSRAQLLWVHCGNCFFKGRRWKCNFPSPVD